MAPGALFRYFETQSALITALCIDAFNELADSMMQAQEYVSTDPRAQTRAVCEAYRQWALAHSGDFALIAGTPIPGYRAEPLDTGPAAVRPILIFSAAYLQAIEAGAATTAQTAIRPVAPGPLLLKLYTNADAADPVMVGVVLTAWTSLTGFLTSEIFGTLGQLVKDVDTLFEDEVTTIMHGMGFHHATNSEGLTGP